jgi:chemotaxis protein MotB
MARKQKHPEHENLERWLVSYADFITLLFATFTALYALAQTDAAKLKDVGEAIREGFAEQSIINGIKSILEGKSPPTANPDPISSQKGAGPGVLGKFDSMTYKPGEVKSLQHLVDDLTSDLRQVSQAVQKQLGQLMQAGQGSASGIGAGPGEDPATPVRDVTMSLQQRGIRISFDSRMLFEPGSAALRPIGQQFLDVVAQRLKKFDNRRFHVEGHTDGTPIATALFPSNWELSAARASRVVRYFIDRHQFNPGSLVAVGYGPTQPIADNRTPEGRSRNRRVDIILYNAGESLKLNPRVQFLGERPLNAASAHDKSENGKSGNDKPSVLPAHAPNLYDGRGASPAAHGPGALSVPRPSDLPVRVIIKEKDGTERVWTPVTKPSPPPGSTLQKDGSHTPATPSASPKRPSSSPGHASSRGTSRPSAKQAPVPTPKPSQPPVPPG